MFPDIHSAYRLKPNCYADLYMGHYVATKIEIPNNACLGSVDDYFTSGVCLAVQ